MQVVDEYFRTIRLVLKGSSEVFPPLLAEKLWDSAVLGYATQQELDEVRTLLHLTLQTACGNMGGLLLPGKLSLCYGWRVQG